MKMAVTVTLLKEYPLNVTQCILVDFIILGVSGLFCHFYNIFKGKSS